MCLEDYGSVGNIDEKAKGEVWMRTTHMGLCMQKETLSVV